VCIYSAYQRTHLQCTRNSYYYYRNQKPRYHARTLTPPKFCSAGATPASEATQWVRGGRKAPRRGPGPWPQSPKGMRAGQMVCLQKGGHFHPVRRERRSFAAPSPLGGRSGRATGRNGPARDLLGALTHLDRGNQNTVGERGRESAEYGEPPLNANQSTPCP
jgi:hypothetical protein